MNFARKSAHGKGVQRHRRHQHLRFRVAVWRRGVLRAKFQWTPEALRETEQVIRSYAQSTNPTQTLNMIEADAADNRILECAAAARSDYIVTGDTRHLLPLGLYDGIPIVKVAQFMRQLSLQAS